MLQTLGPKQRRWVLLFRISDGVEHLKESTESENSQAHDFAKSLDHLKDTSTLGRCFEITKVTKQGKDHHKVIPHGYVMSSRYPLTASTLWCEPVCPKEMEWKDFIQTVVSKLGWPSLGTHFSYSQHWNSVSLSQLVRPSSVNWSSCLISALGFLQGLIQASYYQGPCRLPRGWKDCQ